MEGTMVDQPKPSDKKLSIPLPFEDAIKAALEVDPKTIPPAPKKPPKDSEKDLGGCPPQASGAAG
jgi:hypothetical protein